MKKILVLFNDKSQFNLANARNIAKESCFELHGLFLKYNKSSADFYYPFLSDPCSGKSTVYEDRLEQASNNVINQRIQQMKDECEQAGICFHATVYDNCSLDELITQSASADLLVMDANLNLKEYFVASVNVGLTDFLINLQCPVNMFSQPFADTRYHA